MLSSDNMDKDFNVSILMDFYGSLLTEKQAEVLDYYYNQDYSLQEIAEYMNISRQGVRDFIKRGEKQLADLENKLRLAEKFFRFNRLADKLFCSISELEQKYNEPDIMKIMKDTLSEMKDSL